MDRQEALVRRGMSTTILVLWESRFNVLIREVSESELRLLKSLALDKSTHKLQ